MRTAMTPKRRAELLGFPVRRMLSAETAILAQLDAIRGVLLVFLGVIVALLALGAGQRDFDSHDGTSVTAVFPP